MRPPDGVFESVRCEVGCCAITGDGEAVCWETRNGEESLFAGDRWVDIGFKYSQSCGVQTDGDIVCAKDYYGSPDNPVARPPEVAFSRVAVGTYHACGITVDDALECWGVTDTGPHNTNEQGQVLDAPEGGQYVYVSSGSMNSCAVDSDGIVTCWGKGTAVNTPP